MVLKTIIETIKGNYETDTNKRLMCMPDFVIVDPESKSAELVEVKFRGSKDFNEYKSEFLFKYKRIRNYQDYWTDMTLIIIMTVEPYITCIRVKDIDWVKHYIKKEFIGSKNTAVEIWTLTFPGIYKKVSEIFPKVNDEILAKTIKDIMGIS